MKLTVDQMKQAIRANDRVCYLSAIMFAEVIGYMDALKEMCGVNELVEMQLSAVVGLLEAKQDELQTIMMEEAYKGVVKGEGKIAKKAEEKDKTLSELLQDAAEQTKNFPPIE